MRAGYRGFVRLPVPLRFYTRFSAVLDAALFCVVIAAHYPPFFFLFCNDLVKTAVGYLFSIRILFYLLPLWPPCYCCMHFPILSLPLLLRECDGRAGLYALREHDCSVSTVFCFLPVQSGVGRFASMCRRAAGPMLPLQLLGGQLLFHHYHEGFSASPPRFAVRSTRTLDSLLPPGWFYILFYRRCNTCLCVFSGALSRWRPVRHVLRHGLSSDFRDALRRSFTWFGVSGCTQRSPLQWQKAAHLPFFRHCSHAIRQRRLRVLLKVTLA